MRPVGVGRIPVPLSQRLNNTIDASQLGTKKQEVKVNEAADRQMHKTMNDYFDALKDPDNKYIVHDADFKTRVRQTVKRIHLLPQIKKNLNSRIDDFSERREKKSA